MHSIPNSLQANEELSGDNHITSSQRLRHYLSSLESGMYDSFFYTNTMKIDLSMPYYIFINVIEIIQTLSIFLVTNDRFKLIPFQDELYWDSRTLGYVKDICWILRIDFHFRETLTGYWMFVCIICMMCVCTVGLGASISIMHKKDKRKMMACRVQRILFTCFTNWLLVPMSDSLLFGVTCGFGIRSNCGYLSNYDSLMGSGLIILTCIHIIIVLSISCYYIEFCSECGSIMSKPHPRFKILKTLFLYIIMIFYNFAGESSIIAVIVCDFMLNSLMVYYYITYIPYYHIISLKMRLVSSSCMISLSISAFLGYLLADLDSEKAGASLIFYSMSVCMSISLYILLSIRLRHILQTPDENINNYYIIEVKARLLLQAKQIQEVQNLYRIGIKKFPNDELLYLWSGLFQLHFRNNHISGVIQCFRGLELAKRLDSKYMFHHFLKSSLGFYKQQLKNDAYAYTKYEKCYNIAYNLQIQLCSDRFEFIKELNNEEIKLSKLQKLVWIIWNSNQKLKDTFERMMRINDKCHLGVRMYADYLETIHDLHASSKFTQAEVKEKANNHEGSHQISFFDENCALLKVSLDRNMIGEVFWINSRCIDIFGFYPSEIIGLNIWEIVAPIVSYQKHDSFLNKFQDTHNYHIIDTFQERFFKHKKGYIFLAKFLVTIVPAGKMMPYFMVCIHKTQLDYEVILLDCEYHFLGLTENLQNKSKYELDRLIQLNCIIPEIDDIIDKLRTPEGCFVHFKGEIKGVKGQCFLIDNSVGGVTYHELKVILFEDQVDFRPIIREQQSIDIIYHEDEHIKEEDLMFSFIDSDSYSRSNSNLNKKEEISRSKSSEEEDFYQSRPHIRFDKTYGSSNSAISELLDNSSSSENSQTNNKISADIEQIDCKSNISSKSSVIMSKFQYIRRLNTLLRQRSTISNHSKLRVKLCLLFIGLIYLCVLSICAGYLNNLLTDQIEKTQNVLDTGNMRLLIQEQSYCVRILGLMKQGLIDTSYQELLIQKLNKSGQLIHDLNYNLQVQSGIDINNEDLENVALWELMSDTSIYTTRSLKECLDILSLYASQISLESIDLPHLNRDTFAIYRNGGGETLQALNISASEHLKISTSYYGYLKVTVDLMLGFTVIITILSIVLLSVPPIIQLYKLKIKGWKIYLSLSPHVLNILYDKTASQLEFFQEMALNIKNKDGNDKLQTIKRQHTKQNTSKKIVKHKAEKYLIGIKLTVHLLISAVIIVIIYYLALNIAGEQFEQEPWIFDYATRRQQLVKSVDLWVTEAVIASVQGVGLKYVMPNGQIVQNPLVYAETVINELEDVEHTVIYGKNNNDLYKLMNEDQRKLVFESACDSCSNILNEGLHSTVDMYIILARYILNQARTLQHPQPNIQELLRILKSDTYRNLMKYDLEYLENPMMDSVDYYFEEYEGLLRHTIYLIKVVILMYGLYFMFAYFYVFKTIAERMSQEVIDTWNMSRYLPFEFQEEYVVLNKAMHKNKSYG